MADDNEFFNLYEISREDLEKYALERAEADSYYELADIIDSMSDQELVDFIHLQDK